MSNVLQFERRVASPEVIAKLIELGYLQRAKHHPAGAIVGAVMRLRRDLCRDGVICKPGTFLIQPSVALAVSSSKDG